MPNPSTISPIQESMIIELYTMHNLSRNSIARQLGIADNAGTDNNQHVLRCLKRHKIPIVSGKARNKQLGNEQRQSIIDDATKKVQAAGYTTLESACEEFACIELCELTGIKQTQLYGALRWAKLNPLKTSKKAQNVRKARRTISDEVLVELYVNQQIPFCTIGEQFGVTPGALSIQANRLGIARTSGEAYFLARQRKGWDGRTDIEILFELWCNQHDIKFTPQYVIPNTKRNKGYDYHIGDNILVELDGEYWHDLEVQRIRDIKYAQIAIDNGYKLYRFRSGEIKKTKSKCFDALLPLFS